MLLTPLSAHNNERFLFKKSECPYKKNPILSPKNIYIYTS
jgi:hypothetical protein